MNLHQYAETHEASHRPSTVTYRLDSLQEWSRRFARLGAVADRCLRRPGPLMQAGFLANAHKPEFSSHDRYGHRIDLVEFHPAYHELMRTAIEHGLRRCHAGPSARRACGTAP